MEKISLETQVTEGEVAVVLGISARHVRRLTEDGIFQKSDGKYNLAKSVQTYITYSKKANTDEDRKMDQAMKKATVKLKSSKAAVAELEANELQGKMHRAEDVEAITSDMVFTIRSALNALPGRLAMEVVNIGTANEAAQIIRKEVNLIMNELADYDYDPEKYQERVRSRLEWEAKENEDDE